MEYTARSVASINREFPFEVAVNAVSKTLFRHVQTFPTVGEHRARLLAKLGVHRAMDLLFYFPRSYEEVAPLQTLEDFVENTRVSFIAFVNELDERVTQSGKHMLGAQVSLPEGGAVRLLWFNQPFRKNSLSAGQKLVVTGVLKSTVLNWEVVQPQIRLLDDDESPETQKPLPVYPLTDGLKQSALRQTMRETLPDLIADVEEALSQQIRTRLGVPSIAEALHDIHFPDSEDGISLARRRFKLQELLVLQLAISLQRKSREVSAIAPVCEPTGKIHARILNRLPFQLTPDQNKAIEEIGHDMSLEIPMNRLLQGDVGSGKTVVAQYAMLLCVAHGCQAAMMAPTEVLARQHAGTLQKGLASSRVRVELLTGSMPAARRREILTSLRKGEIDLLVGTQAILSQDVEFHQLGLVIVDEQHKFGVLQRAKLRTDTSQPHYLVLSATPIPRTIAMTAFGDLDVSTIRTKPPGRAPVHTYLSSADQLSSWWNFVDKQLDGGRQAYVIAPRVTESTDGQEVASAEGIFAQLKHSVFTQRSVGILHGRLSSAEKESVLGQFAGGEIDVLVATTVVEVGIDVANATVMTILDANRLGLSQLHQLRGRVSRGSHPGYVCAVASTNCEASDNDRLKAFEKCDDGFELAEMDLQMRGPGDLLGTTQSGLPPMRMANLIEDAPLVELAQEVAREILNVDPDMESSDLEKLRQQTFRRYGESMQLSDVG